MARVDYILRLMKAESADSLRMLAGRPPELYFGRDTKTIDIPPFNSRQMQEFVRELTTPEDLHQLHAQGQIELLYEYEGQLYEAAILNGSAGMEAWFRLYLEDSQEAAATIDDGRGGTYTASSDGGGEVHMEVADVDAAVDRMMALRDRALKDLEARGKLEVDLMAADDKTSFPGMAAEKLGGTLESMGRAAPVDVRAPVSPPSTRRQSQPAVPLPEPPRVPAASGPSMSMKMPEPSDGVDGFGLDMPLPEEDAWEAPSRGPTRGPMVQTGEDGELHFDIPISNMPPSGGLHPAHSVVYTRQEATIPPIPRDSRLGQKEFHRLLRWMCEQDATDLHITPSYPPTLRADGIFQPSQGRAPTPDEVQKVLLSILNEFEHKELRERQSVDLAYALEGLGRFRINIFRQMHGFSAAVRRIAGEVTDFSNLNLPQELAELADLHQGLVLFTGPTGSGKSTTMATLMERMNVERQLHILTLEQPVEHMFESKNSLIQQREVGRHTASFNQGLKDALRENPDVIMVGELRELETVQMALSASETGHLILATMHANSSGNAISRLVDVFPDNEKAGARAMIAETLQAVVNLRLLKHKSGRGLVPAVELLKMSPAIGRVIREGKMHQIKQVLSTARGEGMWPFEFHLAQMVIDEKIKEELGFAMAPERSMFEQYVSAMRLAIERAEIARKEAAQPKRGWLGGRSS